MYVFIANYLSHSKVDELINPYNTFSLAKLDEKIYMSYIKLFQLSRRSRYLLSENFKKAIYHLDIIINFIKNDYSESFERVDIKCIDLKGLSFENFSIIR